MRRYTATLAWAAVSLALAGTAGAQTWQGPYAGAFIGGGFQRDAASETVGFDTNLDGTFSDTVRTAAGANAFSPGFCAGRPVSARAADGCSSDRKRGLDFGGYAGYDWQAGRLVAGGLVDVSRVDVTDSVTAFSTTPAFYSFTRTLNYVLGFRGRLGVGSRRLLVYGTGGAAWGSVEQGFTTSNAVNTFVAVKQDDAKNQGALGYQAGAGVEARFGGRWSFLGEYLFTRLDNRDESTIRSQGPAPATNAFILVNPAGTDLQRTDQFDIQTTRISLRYRF
jgi:outer membrane immunogenic protein